MCLVTQSCLALCDTMECSPPASFVHGDSPGKNTGVGCHALLQGIFPTQGSSQPRDRSQVSCIAGGFFTIWATREAPNKWYHTVLLFLCLIYVTSRSVHVAMTKFCSFFFYNWVIFHYMCVYTHTHTHTHPIPSLFILWWTFSLFPYLVIVNNAAVNIGMHKIFPS